MGWFRKLNFPAVTKRNKDSPEAHLGNSIMASEQNSVGDLVPHSLQMLINGINYRSLAQRNKTWNILNQDRFRMKDVGDPQIFLEQVITLVVQRSYRRIDRKSLTGWPPRNQI